MVSKFMVGAMVAGALTAIAAMPVHAAWPEKNITFLIAYGPGGGFDTITRKLAPILKQKLGGKVNIIAKNLPGGRGKKAATFLAKRKPDGYNILMFNMPGHAMPNIIGEKAGYDVRKIDWLARVAIFRYLIVTSAKTGKYKTIQDVLKSKKQIKIPITGPSSTGYIASTILFNALGITPKYITGYKSAPKYALAVIRGDGDLTILAKGTFEKYVSSKKKKREAYKDLRPILEVTNNKRSYGVTTTGELGRKDLAILGGDRIIGTTPGTPKAIKDKLARALYASITDPGFMAWGKKAKRGISPMKAEDAEKLVHDLFNYYSKYKGLLSAANKRTR
ncbi:tripartite tricarboxylate transporter substrate-binding protein [Alphaproteobacteria bacterium]|nr:tripartite tricarboxylate transporter substrate-binding protein [Alphaproteobacteria bacterium]